MLGHAKAGVWGKEVLCMYIPTHSEFGHFGEKNSLVEHSIKVGMLQWEGPMLLKEGVLTIPVESVRACGALKTQIYVDQSVL